MASSNHDEWHAPIETDCSADKIIAVDPPLRAALRIIPRIAPRDTALLIAGPAGVGKRLLAKLIHRTSRRPGPLLVVDCRRPDAMARFECHPTALRTMAQGSTLVISEVDQLTPEGQRRVASLVDCLGRRVGGLSGSRVVVTASSLPPQNTALLPELYYRVSTFVLEVPALATRQQDLQRLLWTYYRNHTRSGEVEFTPSAERILLDYSWPGNVTELQDVVARILSDAPRNRVRDESGVSTLLARETLLQLAPELRVVECGRLVREKGPAIGPLQHEERQ